MALSESPSIAYGGGQPETPHHRQSQSQSQFEKSPEASPLIKAASSIFSLTLDEIQVKSGKSFGSMNMDEFLTNLWNNVDDNQVSSSQPNDDQNQNRNQPIDNNIIETEPTLSLRRQNSFSIPIQLCKKTVDQVWSEIQKEQPQHPNLHDHIGNQYHPQRQPTFGEITLEEFLIKAGVVQEPTPKPRPPPPSPALILSNNTCLDATYGIGATCHMMALGFSTQPSMGSNLLVNGYAAYPIFTTPTKTVGEQLANNVENDKSQGMSEVVDPKGNRKRMIDGRREVVVERRQRRMIKNRESAARSRARKQAYTVELELELTQLKEENDKLKETVKEFEQNHVQEIMKRIKQPKMARKKIEKLRTLRRIGSSTW